VLLDFQESCGLVADSVVDLEYPRSGGYRQHSMPSDPDREGALQHYAQAVAVWSSRDECGGGSSLDSYPCDVPNGLDKRDAAHCVRPWPRVEARRHLVSERVTETDDHRNPTCNRFPMSQE